MNNPTFVIADDCLHMFSSPERAGSDMEGQDVDGGVYEAAYNSKGHLLKIEVAAPYDVVLRDNDPVVERESELREHLIRSLRYHKHLDESRKRPRYMQLGITE